MTAVNKSWSFERAQQAQDRFQANGGRSEDPAGPLYQWTAMHTLDELRKKFEAGEKYALMLALRKCANHDLPMPDWVSRAYIRAFDTVHNYRAKSWDAVFGAPLPKGAQLAALRKKRLKSIQVWNEVQSRLSARQRWNETESRYKSAVPIDDALFEQIGQKLGLGLTITKKYYAHAKAIYGWRPGRTPKKSTSRS